MIVTIHRNIVCSNFARNTIFLIGKPKNNRVTDKESKNFYGAQIDLLIDRRDQTINLCEMKFSQSEFEITKQYDERLRERAAMFRAVTKTRKALHQTFVTTYGLKKNMYSGNVQSEVVLDDLFTE